MEKVPMTAQGLKTLELERNTLRSTERPAIIAAISVARELGDLSENAEYHAAREKQSFIEGRILELDDIIARAEVIDISNFKGKIIRFGATVTLCDAETQEVKTYQIVGSYESNIDEGRLSYTAPIAKALIGKEEGDEIMLTTIKGRKTYEILEVAYKG